MEGYIIPIYIVLGVLGCLLAVVVSIAAKHAYRRKIAQMAYQGAMVVDVRSAAEFTKNHYPAAINIPYQDISNHIDKLPISKSQPVIFYCVRGVRARIAARELQSMGYGNVHAVSLKVLPW